MRRAFAITVSILISLPFFTTVAMAAGPYSTNWYVDSTGPVTVCVTTTDCSTPTTDSILSIAVSLNAIQNNNVGQQAWIVIGQTCGNAARTGNGFQTLDVPRTINIFVDHNNSSQCQAMTGDYTYEIGYVYSDTSPTDYPVGTTSLATIWIRYGQVTDHSQTTTSPPVESTDNGGTDANCIWTINPVKWLKCVLVFLFVPDSAVMNGWTTRIDAIKAKPPISVITGTFGNFSYIFSFMYCGADTTHFIGAVFASGSSCLGNGGLPTNVRTIGPNAQVQVNIISSASDLVQEIPGAGVMYRLLTYALWVFFFFAAWQMIAGAFGDKGSPMPGSVE